MEYRHGPEEGFWQRAWYSFLVCRFFKERCYGENPQEKVLTEKLNSLIFDNIMDKASEENGIKGVLRKCKTPLFESKNDRFV